MSKLHYITYFGHERGRPELVEATVNLVAPFVDHIHVYHTSKEFAGRMSGVHPKVTYDLGDSKRWPYPGDTMREAFASIPNGDTIIWHDSDERPSIDGLRLINEKHKAGSQFQVFGTELRYQNSAKPEQLNIISRPQAFTKTDGVSVWTGGCHSHPFSDCIQLAYPYFYHHFKSPSLFAQSTFIFFLSDPENNATFDEHPHTEGWDEEHYAQWKPIQEKHGANNLDVVGGWNIDRKVPGDVEDLLRSWHNNLNAPRHMRIIADYVFDMKFNVEYPESYLSTF